MEGKVWTQMQTLVDLNLNSQNIDTWEVWMMKSLSAGCVNIVSTCDYFWVGKVTGENWLTHRQKHEMNFNLCPVTTAHTHQTNSI